jgi:hypothetical protein
MNSPLRIASILLTVCCLSVQATDHVNLAPNAILSFTFPDLPETFFSKATHQKYPPMLSARLPENYTRDGKFPLFVFLNGGNGGRGDSSPARDIVGPRDFIVVSVPLFRDASGAKAPPLPGVNTDALVNINDAPVLGASYRVMLQKLLDAVPNISTERSTLGGFSNGAHATGALLAAKDPFILDHFTAFCFFEGGMALAMNPSALQEPALKHCRFIALFGDHDKDPKLQTMRKLVAEPLVDSLAREASLLQLDFTRIVMKGYGHETPPEYQKLLGSWIRGEKLPEIPAK